ncbi:extracellular solute-binding protein [Alicyclobacillus kakegawensis]|uniref:extracellular solute-binding protein n=1 Tax=Alicyclobacillus kakegawensis TaxID=392012 RepID=UPI0008322A54|nr:extracellular solute-binding protein [Alicyclobacillus kakegawensis]
MGTHTKSNVAKLVIGASLIAILATGCGAQNATNSAQSNSGSPNGETITFWADQEAPENYQAQVWKKVLGKFKQQTGITVKYQMIPWSDLWQKILGAVSSGNGPDVVAMGNTWASTLAATGGFVQLTPDKVQQIGGSSKFIPACFVVTGLAGHSPIAVPYLAEADALYYNKQMFQDAGIGKPPTTWSEFVADAQKLTKNGVYGFGTDGASVTDNAHIFFDLLNQNGGSFFDNNGKPALTSTASTKAASFFADLRSKYKVMAPDSAEWNDSDVVAAFAHKKIAMMIMQDGYMTQLKQDGMNDSEYGVAPIPMIPYGLTKLPAGGSMTGSHVAGIDVGILKSSKHLQADLKFLKYITDPQTQITLCKAFNLLPVNPDAYKDPAFQSPKIKVFEDILRNHAKPTPLVNNYGQVEQIIGTHIKNILSAAAQNKLQPNTVTKELSQANQEVASISQ